MKKIALTLLAAIAVASPTAAQVIVSVTTIEHVRVYDAIAPVCTDAMTPEAQYRQARMRWESTYGSPGDVETMYLCAAQAVLAGYAPAQTLLGRTFSHVRTGPFNMRMQPLYGSPEAALYWFEKAADGGDGRGAFEAGQIYEFAAGVPQDDARALSAYQRAISLGYLRARDAAQLVQNRDARIAKFQAQTQAKAGQGDAKAMRLTAEAYLNGNPFRTDVVVAKTCMEKAAEAGDARAQSELGVFYEHGVGTAKDENGAVDWILRASAAGAHDTDIDLWNMHEDGGLDPAHMVAIEARSASRKLIGIFSTPLVITPIAAANTSAPEPQYDLAQLTRQAEAGDQLAEYNLGIVYLEGKGVAADPQMARKWLEKVATQDPDADMNLGDMAYTGKMGAPDYALAVKWYEAAGAMGLAPGAQNAAVIYDTGKGDVAADPLKAYAMALMAQRLGSQEARSLVAHLEDGLSMEDRARAIAYLNRLQLAHIGL